MENRYQTPPDRHIPNDVGSNEKDFTSSMFGSAYAYYAIILQTAVVPVFIGAAYYIANLIRQEIKKRLTCSIRIESSDEVYRKVLKFLTEMGYLQHSMS